MNLIKFYGRGCILSTKLKIPSFHINLSNDLPKEGLLDRTPAYVVLLWMKQFHFSGQAIFQREDRIKHIHVKNGILIATQSNLVREGLDMVLKRGFLDHSKVAAMELLSSEPNHDLDWDTKIAQQILNEKLLTPEALTIAMNLVVQERLLNLLGWFDGKYLIQQTSGMIPTLPKQPPLSLHILFEHVEKLLLYGLGCLPIQTIAIQPKQKDDLQDLGGNNLISALAERKATGTLLLEKGKKTKIFQLANGVIQSVTCSDPSENLENVLRRWNYLPLNVVAKVVAKIDGQAEHDEEALCQLITKEKILTKDELSSALSTLCAERTLEAFSWRSGVYEFEGSFGTQITVPNAQILYSKIIPLSAVSQFEDTEKKHCKSSQELYNTADALSNLVTSSLDHSLLFLDVSSKCHFQTVTFTKKLAMLWAQQSIRTIIIEIQDNPELIKNWEVCVSSSTEKEPLWKYFSVSKTMNFDFHDFCTKLYQHYDRIVWISATSELDQQLLTTMTNTVFVFYEQKTSRKHLSDALVQLSQARVTGFVFGKKESVFQKISSYIFQKRSIGCTNVDTSTQENYGRTSTITTQKHRNHLCR